MTFRRSNNRPLSCDVLSHRNVDRISRQVLPANKRTFDCECLTCGATWTETTWQE